MIAQERLQEVAAGLQHAIEKEFGCTFVVKEEETLHRVIAAGFDLAAGGVDKVRELASFLSIDVPKFGLPTGSEYLSDFGTTIGSCVALPRSWYLPENALTRILVGPHEGGHVGQDKAGVDAGWWPRSASHTALYLCSIATKDAAEYLGKIEGDQYATTEALRGWCCGARRPLDEIAEGLRRHYALMSAGVDMGRAVLRTHYRTMDNGGVPNVRSARVAIDWLETNAPDLKGLVAL